MPWLTRSAICLAILAGLIQPALAEKDDAAADEGRSSTEYFAFQFGFGSYVGAVGLDVATLRWEHFFWEVVHSRMTGFIDVGMADCGTLAGVPFHLDAGSRHELRLGLGAGMCLYFKSENSYAGFGLTPHIGYLLRSSPHFAWEYTLEVNIPVAGSTKRSSPSSTWQPPAAAFTLTAGIRF